MRFIKPCVRSGTKIVQQVAGRLTERSQILKARLNISKRVPRIKKKGRFLVAEGFTLESQFKNCWFLTHNNQIMKYVSVKKTASQDFVVFGIEVCSRNDCFKVSLLESQEGESLVLPSNALHIYSLKLNAPTRRVEVLTSSIKCKLVPVFKPSRPLSRTPEQRSPRPD